MILNKNLPLVGKFFYVGKNRYVGKRFIYVELVANKFKHSLSVLPELKAIVLNYKPW